jgi:hypothetical protein
MHETTMAEGIVYVLPHLAAVCFETSELHGLPVSYLSQNFEFVTPEKIV